MITVYVKHYLNTSGQEYFNTEWYPYIQSIIQNQPGFISINSSQNKTNLECINITVKFTNAEMLYNWAKKDIHQEIVNNLDPYRVISKGQRWFVNESDDSPPPINLDEWEVKKTDED